MGELRRVLKPESAAHILVDCYAERPSTAHWSERMGLALHHLSEADWRAAFESAGFSAVESARVQDTRGPGEAADFQAGSCFPDWESYVRFHEAGSLWIHARS